MITNDKPAFYAHELFTERVGNGKIKYVVAKVKRGPNQRERARKKLVDKGHDIK